MTKRRVANVLCFKGRNVIKAGGQLPIVSVLSGTGTIAASGILTIVAGAVATQAYITVSSGTNIGTIIGTA